MLRCYRRCWPPALGRSGLNRAHCRRSERSFGAAADVCPLRSSGGGGTARDAFAYPGQRGVRGRCQPLAIERLRLHVPSGVYAAVLEKARRRVRARVAEVVPLRRQYRHPGAWVRKNVSAANLECRGPGAPSCAAPRARAWLCERACGVGAPVLRLARRPWAALDQQRSRISWAGPARARPWWSPRF